MLRYCANLKAIRYESTSLNRIVADKSHRVIVALPVFVFVYIHFNVPPTRMTDLVRNVSDEKVYRHGTVTFVYVLLLSTWFVFSQLYS